MAVEKIYTCDLCGQQRPQADLIRLGIRGLDERPEEAENVDVGTCCRGRPVNDVAAVLAARWAALGVDAAGWARV